MHLLSIYTKRDTVSLTSMASAPVNCSSSTSASCCCSSQLLDEVVGEVASGVASGGPRSNGSSNIRARSAGSGGGGACSAGGAADGAARVDGGMCVALVSGADSKSSEELEEPWEYVEELALAEGAPARLALFTCPAPRRSPNTAQRKPAGVLADTATPAQTFDEIERPRQLFDEAPVDAAERAGVTAGAARPKGIGASDIIWARSAGSGDGAVGGMVSSAEDGAVGGMAVTADGAERVVGGTDVGGWTRRLAETAGSLTGAAVVVLAGGEHGADTRAQD